MFYIGYIMFCYIESINILNLSVLISNMINTDGYDLHKQKLSGILKFLRVLGKGILRTESLRTAAFNVPY